VEARRYLARILDGVDRADLPGPLLAQQHALDLLEEFATPRSIEILEAIAQGAPKARLTEQAKAALARIARRPAPLAETNR
jgi:hypothetical protein